MTADHKAALAAGRQESRAVKTYLDAIEAHRPKRGRKRTSDSIRRRLESIDAQLDNVDALNRVNLLQERMDLETELASMADTDDLGGLEQAFVDVARSYSERKGITYAAWRMVGVPASVLKQAGISRSM